MQRAVFPSENRDECPRDISAFVKEMGIVDIYIYIYIYIYIHGSTDICHHRGEDVITDFGIGARHRASGCDISVALLAALLSAATRTSPVTRLYIPIYADISA